MRPLPITSGEGGVYTRGVPKKDVGAATNRLSHEQLNATAASILGFLSAFGPMTGFDLMSAIEDVIGDFWHVTKSQIYKELKLLARLEMVETLETGTRDKQPYEITGRGRDTFRAWIGQKPTPPIMRMPIVLEVFFGGEVPFEKLREHIEAMHAHHVSRLRTYETFAEQAEKGTWPHEALRLGFMFQRAMIEWLETLPKKPLTIVAKTPRPAKTRAKKSQKAGKSKK